MTWSATAVGVMAGLGGLVAGGRGADDGFDPTIRISDDGLSFRLAYDDVEPDTVTVHTADGTVHEFTGAMAREGGYRRGWDALHIDDGWYGPIERVEATRGSKTVVAEAGREPSLRVTCSLWRTPDRRPDDFRMEYDHASLWYDPPVGDEPVYGSPGRVLRSVEDVASELRIDFDNRPDCEPDGDVAVVFDDDAVTVHPEEFVTGVAEIYRPQLTFADGSRAILADRDDPIEPPVTFVGDGEHAGTPIRELHFRNDPGGETAFTYRNPDLDHSPR